MSDNIQMSSGMQTTSTPTKPVTYNDTDRELEVPEKTYLNSYDNVRGIIGQLRLTVPAYKDPNNQNITLKPEHTIEFTNGQYSTKLLWIQQFIEQHPHFKSGNIYDAMDGKPVKGKEHVTGDAAPKLPRETVELMVKASGMNKAMLLDIAKANGAEFTAEEEAAIRDGSKDSLSKAQIGERIK